VFFFEKKNQKTFALLLSAEALLTFQHIGRRTSFFLSAAKLNIIFLLLFQKISLS